DERATVRGAYGKGAAVAADVGVDDREVHAHRHEVNGVPQDDRSLKDRLRVDPVRDIDDVSVRGDARHHAVARADEVVVEAEVGEERDDRHPADFIRSRTAATSPSRSCVAASTATCSPTERATREVCGPMLTAGARPPIAAYARAAEPDASTTASPAGGSGVRRRVR